MKMKLERKEMSFSSTESQSA